MFENGTRKGTYAFVPRKEEEKNFIFGPILHVRTHRAGCVGGRPWWVIQLGLLYFYGDQVQSHISDVQLQFTLSARSSTSTQLNAILVARGIHNFV
jgi:hypothetical protein